MTTVAVSGTGKMGSAMSGRSLSKWRGRDGNDPSVDIAKDADQRF
jgi:hypothetical protein